NFFLDNSVWEYFLQKLTEKTDDFEYFVQKIARVSAVKVYQGNNHHIFENDLRKLFNQNRIIAYIIQVTEGDGGLDLLLSYKGNQICVQYKDRENALTLSILKEFEFTMIHFKNLLEILVYN
ncbi:20541_t:CDS:2, partial [Racocetra persica]